MLRNLFLCVVFLITTSAFGQSLSELNNVTPVSDIGAIKNYVDTCAIKIVTGSRKADDARSTFVQLIKSGSKGKGQIFLTIDEAKATAKAIRKVLSEKEDMVFVTRFFTLGDNFELTLQYFIDYYQTYSDDSFKMFISINSPRDEAIIINKKTTVQFVTMLEKAALQR